MCQLAAAEVCKEDQPLHAAMRQRWLSAQCNNTNVSVRDFTLPDSIAEEPEDNPKETGEIPEETESDEELRNDSELNELRNVAIKSKSAAGQSKSRKSKSAPANSGAHQNDTNSSGTESAENSDQGNGSETSEDDS